LLSFELIIGSEDLNTSEQNELIHLSKFIPVCCV